MYEKKILELNKHLEDGNSRCANLEEQLSSMQLHMNDNNESFQASLHMHMEQKEAVQGWPFTAYERRLAEDEVFEEVYGRDGHGRIRCCDRTISPTDYFRIPTAPPVDEPIDLPVTPTPPPVTPTPAPIGETLDHAFRPSSSTTPSAEAITQRDLARWRITKQCLEAGIPVPQEIVSDDWWPESSSL